MREIKVDIIETQSVQCRMINDEVFHAYLKPDSTSSSEEINFIVEEYNKQTLERPMKFLLEMAPFASLDIDGCESLKKSKLATICEAFVTTDLAQLLVINFHFRTKSKTHPSKMFKTRNAAMSWLKSCH